MKRTCFSLVASVGFVALLCVPSTTWAQVAPTLGAAERFGVLGNSAVTGSTGSGTLVNGDVGSYPTPTINNFPPSRTVAPSIVHYSADGVVQQAHTDAKIAYDFLAGQGGSSLNDNLSTNGIIGPGVYSLGAADLPASTTLTLNGSGIFIFNVASTLTMNGSSVVIGSANPCNVYWRVGTSATLNGTAFIGTVIADASITVGGGIVSGRVLAGTGSSGAVTMAGEGGNTIGGCSAAGGGCPTITLAPPTLPAGTVGVAYSQQITASGGTGPYTFSVASGTLPAGLTLTAGGLLSGTPTTAGSSPVTIQATDGIGCPGVIPYTIVIVPVITLAPATLPNGTVGVAYSQTIVGSGGTAPYTFSVTVGALPAGVTLTAAGVLAGTPTTAGQSIATIRGTDANGNFKELSYTVVISSPVPTLPQWSALLLAAGLLSLGYLRLRRRSAGTARIS